jgi:hypothetical protein
MRKPDDEEKERKERDEGHLAGGAVAPPPLNKDKSCRDSEKRDGNDAVSDGID